MRIFVVALLSILSQIVSGQHIAITFDDAPTPDGPLYDGSTRTAMIIRHLQQEKITAAFFVITSQINPSTKKRIDDYTGAGHLVANHTHTHRSISNIGLKNYLRDIVMADEILRPLPGFRNWFRYPFLDEGRTMTVRDSIRRQLADLNLTNGYVTVDNYDWYLNHLLKSALADNRQVDYDKLRALYVEHILTSIRFYDDIARMSLGRSPKHVLLLHENDLAAHFLPDLISALRRDSWAIISPDEAFADPIASHTPNVLFNGQGRVAAIAREQGVPARKLVQVSEDEAYLDSLVAVRKIFR